MAFQYFFYTICTATNTYSALVDTQDSFVFRCLLKWPFQDKEFALHLFTVFLEQLCTYFKITKWKLPGSF